MAAFGMQEYLNGVRVTGEPVRASGDATRGSVDFLTSGTSGGVHSYETRRRGALTASGIWYEGALIDVAPFVDLTSSSLGNLALAAFLIS